MISGVKIITFLFIFFAWSRIAIRVKKGEARIAELVSWSIIWLVTGVAAMYPGTTDKLAKLLGVGRGFDAAVFFAILIIFYSIYRNYIKLTQIEKDITKLTRELALREAEKEE